MGREKVHPLRATRNRQQHQQNQEHQQHQQLQYQQHEAPVAWPSDDLTAPPSRDLVRLINAVWYTLPRRSREYFKRQSGRQQGSVLSNVSQHRSHLSGGGDGDPGRGRKRALAGADRGWAKANNWRLHAAGMIRWWLRATARNTLQSADAISRFADVRSFSSFSSFSCFARALSSSRLRFSDLSSPPS